MAVAEEDDGYRRERQSARRIVHQVAQRLTSLAEEQVTKKVAIEDRWHQDLRQYHGRYEPDIEAALKAAKKSRLFINETRSKTHAWESRLSDMLFPTDDDNWGIEPTSVPELLGASRLMQVGTEDSDRLKKLDELARARCDSMREEIRDQLGQAQYSIKARQIIHDSCKMGVGIMKGPIIETKTVRRYQQVTASNDEVPDSGGTPKRYWKMVTSQDPRPGWERVDPWNYFPDMSARTIEEAEFHFERHQMNRKKLQRLARVPGFNKDAIRTLLGGSPQDPIPDYLTKLRDISDGPTFDLNQKYQVWEYHGPLDAHELKILAFATLEGDDLEDEMDSLEEMDPLDERDAVVWFCQGMVIKYGPALLETGDPLYSAFSFEQDDSSPFGFGVPFLMRDSQAAMNAAWRMTMDNAGLSVGPQIVVNRELVTPADGKWELSPRKVWLQHKNLPFPTKAFEAFSIDSRQNELANIIEMSQRFADDETNMPMIAQGEQGAGARNTGMGMSILMNSVNVVFRRVVKNFDDYLTVPNIRRQYDWNMAFNPKEMIKGDFEIAARGSSVLLVRELQAQNLMSMVSNFSDHPIFGDRMKKDAMFRKLLQAHMLPTKELYKSDAEIQAEEKERAAQPPPPDPEMIKLETQLQIATIEGENKIKLALIQQETALIGLAEKRNMTVEQLQAKIQVGREQNQSSERKLAAEIAFDSRNPEKQTGGSV